MSSSICRFAASPAGDDDPLLHPTWTPSPTTTKSTTSARPTFMTAEPRAGVPLSRSASPIDPDEIAERDDREQNEELRRTDVHGPSTRVATFRHMPDRIPDRIFD